MARSEVRVSPLCFALLGCVQLGGVLRVSRALGLGGNALAERVALHLPVAVPLAVPVGAAVEVAEGLASVAAGEVRISLLGLGGLGCFVRVLASLLCFRRHSSPQVPGRLAR